MDKLNLSDQWFKALDTVEFIDDFIGLDTTTWLTTVTDSGTVAEDADGINGVVTMSPSDGTVGNNDEAYLYTNEIAKYLNGTPISIVGRIQFTEGNTDDVNILFGIGEGFGVANTLLDDGGGPPADYDGCCFFKVDGGTRWNFESSDGTSQVTTELDYTAGGSSFAVLQLDLEPLSATEYQITPWLDILGGKNLVQPRAYSANQMTLARLPLVKHRFTYAGSGEMAVCFGIKNGAATTVEALQVDLCMFAKKR